MVRYMSSNLEQPSPPEFSEQASHLYCAGRYQEAVSLYQVMEERSPDALGKGRAWRDEASAQSRLNDRVKSYHAALHGYDLHKQCLETAEGDDIAVAQRQYGASVVRLAASAIRGAYARRSSLTSPAVHYYERVKEAETLLREAEEPDRRPGQFLINALGRISIIVILAGEKEHGWKTAVEAVRTAWNSESPSLITSSRSLSGAQRLVAKLRAEKRGLQAMAFAGLARAGLSCDNPVMRSIADGVLR